MKHTTYEEFTNTFPLDSYDYSEGSEKLHEYIVDREINAFGQGYQDGMRRAEVDEKSPSERLKAVLYVWYKQETEAGRYVGLFEAFRKDQHTFLSQHFA